MIETFRKYLADKLPSPTRVDTSAFDTSLSEVKSEIELHRVDKQLLSSKLDLEPTGYVLGDAVIGRRIIRAGNAQTGIKP